MSIRNKLLQDILSAIGGGGSVIWGSITGNIVDQTDLATVAKTNDYDDLDNKFNPETDVTVDRMVTGEYTNASPSTGIEYNTLYDPAPITETTTEVSAIALVTAGGLQYAVFSRLSATALVTNPDVRISRSSTFPGVTGSTELTYWYDSVTSTIHMEADFNGGGKVLDELQIVSAFDGLVSV
jgi:hypothetical protein